MEDLNAIRAVVRDEVNEALIVVMRELTLELAKQLKLSRELADTVD